MAIQWEVVALTAMPFNDDERNYVIAVHWKIVNTEDSSKFLYGVTDVQNVDDAHYTEFEVLTTEEAIGWVKQALGNDITQEYENIVLFNQEENLIIELGS